MRWVIIFKNQGLSDLSQKINYIAANIHMNNISVEAVQQYFFKYTGAKRLFIKVQQALMKKESALFFEYLTGKKKLTLVQAQVNVAPNQLPSAGQSSIAQSIEGKIVVFNKSGYLME